MDLLKLFEPVSLEEMSTQAVFHRKDTKYILSNAQLETLLKGLYNDFKILEINLLRIFNYETHYFDTPEFRFYLDHHNGLERRIKVRYRSYLDNGLHFLEVKQKKPDNWTVKQRFEVKQINTTFSLEDIEKMAHYDLNFEELVFQIKNGFNRVTLVGKNSNERITIDTNVRFEMAGKNAALDNIVILELKQDKYATASIASALLKKLRVRPSSISKYAMGIVLFKAHPKYHNFKPILRKIISLQKQNNK